MRIASPRSRAERTEARAELGGFSARTWNLELVLNQDAEINVMLVVTGVTESIQVTSEAPMVETTKSEMSRTFTSKQIADLPLPGRNYLNLMLSVPGATTGGTGASGFGVAVNGQRPRQVNFIIDGSDNNDASVTGTRSPIIQDAVGEFRLVTSVFGAELGRNTGAVAQASTKSGTNAFHGTLYEFYEDGESLNARTNLEKAANFAKPGKLRRDTYGFTFGGPIQRDKMFFFGAYQRRPFEGRGASTPIQSPTQAGRELLAALPGVSTTMLDLMRQHIPLPNSGATQSTAVAGVPIPWANYIATLPNENVNNQTITRVDRTLGAKDTIYGRYIYSKTETIGASNPPGFANDSVFPTHNFVTTWNKVLSPTMLNEFHFSYGQSGGLFPGGSTNPAGNNDLSTISIGQGFPTIGLAVNIPQDRKEKVWQFTDSFSYLRGTHAFKFGADVRYVDLTSFVPFDFRGTYTYQTLEQFAFNRPFSVLKAYGEPGPDFTYFEQGYYAQDDWKIKPNLTLNLGVRYERVGAAQDWYSNVATDNNNFGPRTGFAWDITGEGDTVVRGGYALTYDYVYLNIPLLTFQSPPFQRRITDQTASFVYPNVPADREITPNEVKTLNLLDMPDDSQLPIGHQWQVGVQRQLFGSMRAEAAYVGSLGRGLIRQRVLNPVFCCPVETIAGPTGAASLRRHGDPTQTGQITNLEMEAKSEYHAAQFSLEKRLSRGYAFTLAYTYSSFYDDASEPLGTGTPTLQRPQNNFDFAAEWSRSAWDRPHRLAVSWLYELPFYRDQQGVFGRILGGWTLNGTYALQSGQPFTIITGVDSNGDGDAANDRPHVNPGGDPTKVDGYIQRPLRSGGDGNLGRNTGRGPGVNNVDLAFFKNLRIAARHQLQFRVEAFNALNHRQFVLLNSGAERTLNNPSRFYDFTQSNGGSRTIVLGLRYLF